MLGAHAHHPMYHPVVETLEGLLQLGGKMWGLKKLVIINEDDDSIRAVSIMWINKNRRFFGGNAEPVTAEDPLYHVSWHQLA